MRESGAIEQDADIVSFIYRPEYYGIDQWDDEEGSPAEGQADLIIAKHRNGGLGNIRLKFIASLGKFESIKNFDSPFEFQSKMNESNKEIDPKRLPYADDKIDDEDKDLDNLPF